jgi:hypothetical protein
MVSALPPDVRENPTIKQLKGFPDAMQMLLNSESMLGKRRVEAPDPNWTDEQYEDFYNAMGRPGDASGYEVTQPEGVAELSERTQAALKEQLDAVLPGFHEAGLTQRQVNILVKHGVQTQIAQDQKIQEAVQSRSESTRQLLSKDYGSAYEAKMRAGHIAAIELLGEEFEPMRHEMLADGSYVLDHPTVVRLFVALGDMMEEGGVTPGAPGGRATMTPEEAKSEINRLKGDEGFNKIWLDKDHPQHKEAVDRMMNLRRMVSPE